MTRRLLFHFFHLLILNVLIFSAVYIYHAIEYPPQYVFYSIVIAYKFIVAQIYNFLLVSVLTYVLSYLTGIIKYTIEDRVFRFVSFAKEIFKLMVILAGVSFIEFFLFFEARIGRLIYVYLFMLYCIYYLLYRLFRTNKGPRSLIWMAGVPADIILKKYIKRPNAFRILSEDEATANAGLSTSVVYQDGSIDDHTSEALIKNKLAGFQVMELVELVERESGKIPLDYVNIHWFLEKFDVIDRNYFRSSRLFNIVISLVLLIVLFPFGIVMALVHRCFSKGTLFFMQERLGLHGKTFKLLKFRTMVSDAEKDGARFAEKHDKRITPIGKFMRRFRFDEIPQLLNVLKGDMSMVGPRPEREVFVEDLAKQIPYYKLRLLVPPGLTGWAQINCPYAGNNIENHKEKLEFDLYYIKNRSIFLDLMILLITVKAIFQGRGE